MLLNREEVRKVALLARLELTDDEIDQQAVNLNGLLDKFEALQEIDVSDVEPTSHSIPMVNILRDDLLVQSLSRESTLANAPESRDGCFIVPRIVGDV